MSEEEPDEEEDKTRILNCNGLPKQVNLVRNFMYFWTPYCSPGKYFIFNFVYLECESK